MGVSGVPWLYTDTRLWSAVALLTLPDDRVRSSTSKGLEGRRKIRFVLPPCAPSTMSFFFNELKARVMITFVH